MADEHKAELTAVVAEVLQDSIGIDTDADRELTAGYVVERIESLLRQQGWRPPETLAQVRQWGSRLGQIPEHHVNHDVLNSHLAELWQIL